MRGILFLGFGTIGRRLLYQMNHDPQRDFVVLSNHQSELFDSANLFRKDQFDDIDLQKVNVVLVSLKSNTPMNRDLIIDLAKRLPGDAIVVNLSSAAVYGRSRLAVETEANLKPISDYGLNKLYIEELLLRSFGERVVNLRIANVYGDQEFNDFVNLVFSCLRTQSALTLFNAGKNVRDYLPVDDLTRGIISIIDLHESNLFKHEHSAFNFGTGVGNSGIQIIQEIENITSSKLVDYVHISNPQEMIETAILNSDTIHQILGFTPRGLSSGLKEYGQVLGF
jgi:nucleoside-diphosphate-sugar epimerase